MLTRRSEVWTRQPQSPVDIDWSNPITSGLIFAYSGASEAVSKTPVNHAGTNQGVYQDVIGIANTNSTSYAALQKKADLNAGAAVTVFADFRFDSSANAAEYAGIVVGAVGGVGKFNLVINNDSGLPMTVGLSRVGDTNQTRFAAANTITTGRQNICAVANGLNYTDIAIYKNGGICSYSTISQSNGSALAATQDIWLSGRSGAARGLNGVVGIALCWNRALSDVEIRRISRNPWQVFAPERRTLFVPSWAGGSLAASAFGSDTASGTGTLAAQVALESVGVSLAGGVATAAASIPLSAAGLSVSGGLANSQATINISAAGLANAAAQAGLSASVLLSAAGAAQSSGNATLAAQIAALASGGDTAGGSANLTGGAPGALNASGGDVASGSAVLSITVQLAAAGGDTAGGSAMLTGNAPGQLSASGGASASGSGIISMTATLTAAGFIRAMGQGKLDISVNLAAFGQSIASGFAQLTQPGANYQIDPKFLIAGQQRDYTIIAAPRDYIIKRRAV